MMLELAPGVAASAKRSRRTVLNRVSVQESTEKEQLVSKTVNCDPVSRISTTSLSKLSHC